MTPERYQQVKEILHAAVERDTGDRESFLAAACAGDEKLRLEVESLLQHEQPAAEFIEESAFEVAARVFTEEDLAIGGRIGPYRIRKEIGRGGMGIVYLAGRDDEQYQKDVAIKIIKRGMDSEAVVRRFLNERQILAQLEHPNIARLIDGGTTDDGVPYFVMEYVDGTPIDEYCKEHNLSVEARLNLFFDACSAVQFAHQNLVIHRDLKPGNILVTAPGAPKLLDFGIAKVLQADISLPEQTATALRVLTPDYASPEQIRGGAITTTSDVYSLGVVLYELLTGARPYRIKSKEPLEIARVISEEEPVRPSAAVRTAGVRVRTSVGHSNGDKGPANAGTLNLANPKSLRGDLDNIILMAMRKEPARRYQSVAQFAEDVRRHLEGLPVIARQDTLAYRTSKFVTRHKTGVAAAALIVLTLVAGIVATLRQARIATAQRDRARQETAKAERINQFLQDTLSFANPGLYSASDGKGPNATIGEALDRAAQRAETELADQPDVLAGVQYAIGMSYLNMTQLDLANKYLQHSVDLNRQVFGDNSVQAAYASVGVGAVLALKGKYPESEALFKNVIAIYRQHAADGTVPAIWWCEVLNDLGLIQMTKGEPVAAEVVLREAVAKSSELSQHDRKAIPVYLTNLGRARVAQGDLNEAETLYRKSVELSRQLPLPEQGNLSVALNYLGDVLKSKYKFDEAEAALRESVEVARRQSGENPNLSIFMTTLADLLRLKGNYGQAEETENAAIAIFKKVLPPEHFGLTYPNTTLGLIMNETGRAAQAEPILRQALAIRQKNLPQGHWQIAQTEGALGECLMRQQKYSEAEPLLLESYHDLKASQGEKNQRTDEARKWLAELYQSWGKPEMAAPYR
jgi:serine/threonine-protein kinase